MGNKVYIISSAGSTEGKPVENKLVKDHVYSDISMRGKYINSDGIPKIDKIIDIQAVKTAMKNLFKFIPGERILNPDFGNKLYGLIYNPEIEYTKERISAEILNMVKKYEPRAAIDAIIDKTNMAELEDNTVKLIIEWHVIGFENTKYQITLP